MLKNTHDWRILIATLSWYWFLFYRKSTKFCVTCPTLQSGYKILLMKCRRLLFMDSTSWCVQDAMIDPHSLASRIRQHRRIVDKKLIEQLDETDMILSNIRRNSLERLMLESIVCLDEENCFLVSHLSHCQRINFGFYVFHQSILLCDTGISALKSFDRYCK